MIHKNHQPPTIHLEEKERLVRELMPLKVPLASNCPPWVREKNESGLLLKDSQSTVSLRLSALRWEKEWWVKYAIQGTVGLILSAWSERKRLEVTYYFDTEDHQLPTVHLEWEKKHRSSVRSSPLHYFDTPGTIGRQLSAWRKRRRLELAYCYDTQGTISLQLSALRWREREREREREKLQEKSLRRRFHIFHKHLSDFLGIIFINLFSNAFMFLKFLVNFTF